MDYPINAAEPLMMHIDLNSCFASVEQQANRLLRGQPVGVAAYTTPNGFVLSPSKEMKARGVKMGRVRDILEVIPEARIIPPDPDKYFFIHKQFSKLFSEYSPDVTPLSIDEAVINFAGMKGILKKSLVEIGMEIKQRMKDEIGDSLTCNIGIGTNRFLAKTAASLHKPDGLDVITHENLRAVYSGLDLMDLCGINTRNKVRLVLSGIYTPVDFLDAPVWQLWKQVFGSVNGYHWYLRLRGWEVDDLSYGRKSYGQQYAMHHFTEDPEELNRLIMKLCEKMGRRLRRAERYASGISLFCGQLDARGWHASTKVPQTLYSTRSLHEAAMALLARRPRGNKLTNIGVSCYGLKPLADMPPTLFDTDEQRQIRLASALDTCNNRYGEFSVIQGRIVGMESTIIKRVPFHATSDTLSEIYEEDDITQEA